HSFRDLMVGAGRIATHAQATDDAAVVVERCTTAEEDRSTGDLTTVSLLTGREQQLGVEQVGLAKTPQRMAWRREGMQSRRGEREVIETECIRRIGLGLRNRLAARPDVSWILG